MATYTVKPWRGPVTGNVYYDIRKTGLLFSSKVLTCFSEAEANEMIVKLGHWDEGEPTTSTLVPQQQNTTQEKT